ncbi:MAG: hypothetical protein WCI87_02650 [Euryarchaeota archaeon]
MLAVECCPDLFAEGALPNHELFEIHRSKSSLHRAKVGYSYPMIRLPQTFSKLAGLSKLICQTVYDGALASLVVVSNSTVAAKSAERSENAKVNVKSLRFDMAEVAVPNPAETLFFLQSATLDQLEDDSIQTFI